MQTSFAQALAMTLRSEGGYVNNPHDPGGATNKGVTQRVYDAYRSAHKLARQSVKFITAAEIYDIYWTQYAATVRYLDLPLGLDYLVFDTAVNSGVGEAIKLLQQVAGVKVDGHLGLVTLNMLQHANVADLIKKYSALRLGYLHRLKTWSYFGKGWTKRDQDADRNALAMLGSNWAKKVANDNHAALVLRAG